MKTYFVQIRGFGIPKFVLLLIVLAISCSEEPRNAKHRALQAHQKPVIDGLADDICWQNATWYPINQVWLGKEYSKDDFEGRYKLAWTNEKLYLLAQIVDDTLIDIHADSFDQYWDDDCLEIFLDEDHSGGKHQFSHNAFAYHIGLDGKVVDFSPAQKPAFYNEHLQVKRTQNGKTSTWEVEIALYDDHYQDGKDNKAVALFESKKIGFAIAYCDNDFSAERENFIGSVRVDGQDKNQGYLNASIFGTLILVKE